MDDTIKVECPCCKTILVINRHKGTVLEQRKPILEQSTGNRFEDAVLKVRKSKEAVEQKFAEAQKKERERKDKLESLFEKELKRVKESGEEIGKPQREIDLE
ncbi:MAG: hypothetical protein NTW86_04115 [Candidatus Sumerlaeota bacterium]|nr:hypothetical protein [Candidatus Sumerlaeota bacterium]